MSSRIEYLHWMEGRPARAEFDLGSSDLGGLIDLQHRRDLDPPDDVTLEAQVAARHGVDPENVLVTAGASHANFLAAAAALDDGGTVLVERPGYEPLVATPRWLGTTVRRFERPDGTLDPADPIAAMDDDTAMVTITDRHNPTGRRAGELAEVATAARDHGARLLVDEVYAPFAPESTDAVGLGSGTAASLDGVVVTGSLTKFFGLGALRIGWLIADRQFVARARDVAGHVPVVSRTSRRTAQRVLHHHDHLASLAGDRIANNAERLTDFVEGRADLVGSVHDCTFGFVRHERASGDAVVAAAWDAGVLVVPGRFFDDPGRFRISVADEPLAVERALDAFGGVLDSL